VGDEEVEALFGLSAHEVPVVGYEPTIKHSISSSRMTSTPSAARILS
jgi:hypothetical protein